MNFYRVLAKPLFLLTFSILLVKSALGANDFQFSIDYGLTYTVSDNGETNVIQKTTITNLVNDVIPTVYTFTAKDMQIYDASAQTNGKDSKVSTSEKDNDMVVSVTMNNYAIGQGRQNEIILKYKTKNIAQKTGKIWNIFIPKIQIPETTTLYDVKLIIPASFGSKIYLSPNPVIEKNEDAALVYLFNKTSLNTSGIAGAFGDYQPVNFKLKYQLQNTWILPLTKEIAIPSDIKDMQQVSYQSISPKPTKIKIDKDGNMIGVYILPPLKKEEIEVVGSAKLFGKQINPSLGKDFKDLPKELVSLYTRPEKYWEVDSPYVQKVAKELKDDKQNVIKNAQKIYNFITTNLTYNFEAPNKGLVQRQGAEAVLTQKESWTCMEFTDLFIAVARAMGIPAREVNGYAFPSIENSRPLSISLKGGDFLHSWPEFYDTQYGWIQIDPTWGTTSGVDYFTKLDTNHFAFVIKGLSSEYPFSAGTYRYKDDGNEKLIDAALSQNISDENFKPNIQVTKSFNWNPIQLILGNNKYVVKNLSGISMYDENGKILAPGASKVFYLNKNLSKVTFKDIRNNAHSIDLY